MCTRVCVCCSIHKRGLAQIQAYVHDLSNLYSVHCQQYYWVIYYLFPLYVLLSHCSQCMPDQFIPSSVFFFYLGDCTCECRERIEYCRNSFIVTGYWKYMVLSRYRQTPVFFLLVRLHYSLESILSTLCGNAFFHFHFSYRIRVYR